MREAKVTAPAGQTNNVEYENALNGLIDGLLGDRRFITCLDEFVSAISYAGRINSLTQTLIQTHGSKVMSPISTRAAELVGSVFGGSR